MSSMQRFITACLLDAAKAIGQARAAGLKITAKERNNMATSADFAAEKLIVGRIRKSYPDSLVLSEESYTESNLEADSLFVIDPIDGTHNFIAGLPLYGISIAHFSGGKPTAGGTLVSPLNMLFYAEKGKPPTLNKKKISVSKTARLEDFFLMCDSRLHTIAEKGYLESVVQLEKMSQHTRFTGCAIYEIGLVACGMADASLFFKLKPYDFAAAAYILERAGGTVTDFKGKHWSLSTKEFVCSNGKQHKRILEILNKR